MRFSKWQALGNSYLIVERADDRALSPVDVRRLCDVHFGLGADGVLEVLQADRAAVEVVVWNPDGTTAELSGNGTRIAARWLAARTGASEVRVVVAGRETLARIRAGGEVEQELGRVEVGAPEALELGGEQVEFIPVSLGNPHAVIRREPDPGELRRLGPLVEHHPRFPERANVQLVGVEGRHALSVLVWERGAGETLSSGTSAVAAAAAAVVSGWCLSPVSVRMPGGELRVELDRGRARLTGPAEQIAEGVLVR